VKVIGVQSNVGESRQESHCESVIKTRTEFIVLEKIQNLFRKKTLCRIGLELAGILIVKPSLIKACEKNQVTSHL